MTSAYPSIIYADGGIVLRAACDDLEDRLLKECPEYRKVKDTLKQTYDVLGKNPDTIHASPTTWDKYEKELDKAGGYGKAQYIINPASNKYVERVADDVPEGRYFFGDK